MLPRFFPVLAERLNLSFLLPNCWFQSQQLESLHCPFLVPESHSVQRGSPCSPTLKPCPGYHAPAGSSGPESSPAAIPSCWAGVGWAYTPFLSLFLFSPCHQIQLSCGSLLGYSKYCFVFIQSTLWCTYYLSSTGIKEIKVTFLDLIKFCTVYRVLKIWLENVKNKKA